MPEWVTWKNYAAMRWTTIWTNQTRTYKTYLHPVRKCHAASNQILHVSQHTINKPTQSRKCHAAVWYSLAFDGSFSWGPCLPNMLTIPISTSGSHVLIWLIEWLTKTIAKNQPVPWTSCCRCRRPLYQLLIFAGWDLLRVWSSRPAWHDSSPGRHISVDGRWLGRCWPYVPRCWTVWWSA